MRHGKRNRLLCGAALSLALLCVPATAQIDIGGPREEDQQSSRPETIKPPRVQPPAKHSAWLYYLVGAACIGGAVAVAVMPSQRTHQD